MKKVLIVDDTKNIRFLLQKCLELEGYEVKSADNGRTGYEMICSEPFDLIFLDIKLPEISGTEVLRRIRREGVLTPVVIITAYPTVKNAVECTQLGSIAYLQKPFTAARLHTVIEEIADAVRRKESREEEAAALMEKGNYASAISILKASLAENPQEAGTYRMLAQAYREMNEEEAARRFEQAAKAFDA